MNFVIVENKKNNYMIEVGSIMTVDLLISDKSNCVGIDFTVSALPWTSWMMSLLLTRQAGHDSGELCLGSKLYLPCMDGGTCTCRRYMYMQG